MAWATATKLGCGQAMCVNGARFQAGSQDATPKIFTVCNFAAMPPNSPGNLVGDTVWTTGNCPTPSLACPRLNATLSPYLVADPPAGTCPLGRGPSPTTGWWQTCPANGPVASGSPIPEPLPADESDAEDSGAGVLIAMLVVLFVLLLVGGVAYFQYSKQAAEINTVKAPAVATPPSTEEVDQKAEEEADQGVPGVEVNVGAE